MNVDIIENTEQTDEFNPDDYTQDIQFIKLSSECKVEVINSKYLVRKVAFENAKTSVATNQTKLDGASKNPSRSTFSNRSFVMGSNADSMKPSTLSYSSATLISIKDHMKK